MVHFTSWLFFFFDGDSQWFLFKVPFMKSRCLWVFVGMRVYRCSLWFQCVQVGMNLCGQAAKH